MKELYFITFNSGSLVKTAFTVAENEKEAVENLEEKLKRIKDFDSYDGVISVEKLGDHTIIL